MLLRTTFALSCTLFAIPFSAGLADVESDTLHNNFYQDEPQHTCDGSPSCIENFSASQQKSTVITNIHCSFHTVAGAQFWVAEIHTTHAALNVIVPVDFSEGRGITKRGVSPLLILRTFEMVQRAVKRAAIPMLQSAYTSIAPSGRTSFHWEQA